jgi:hypothetical protein
METRYSEVGKVVPEPVICSCAHSGYHCGVLAWCSASVSQRIMSGRESVSSSSETRCRHTVARAEVRRNRRVPAASPVSCATRVGRARRSLEVLHEEPVRPGPARPSAVDEAELVDLEPLERRRVNAAARAAAVGEVHRVWAGQLCARVSVAAHVHRDPRRTCVHCA